MRAWQVTEVGSIDSMQLFELDDPIPGPGEVLISVDAIGLNSSEMQLVEGWMMEYGVPPEVPWTPGTEAAGTVVAVGSEADLPVGARVAVHYVTGSGPNPATGPAGKIGRTMPGCWATKVIVPQSATVPLPQGLDSIAAAATIVNGGTALHMLVHHGKLEAGQCVLVVGASSAIGTFGVRLAKHLGAQVIATSSTGKLDRVKALAPDHVIDHELHPDFAGLVLDLTDGRGVDIVYDVPGAATLGQGVRCIVPNGRIVIGGYMSGTEASVPLLTAISREAHLIGSNSWTIDELETALQLVADGAVAPVIDKVYRFEELRDGVHRMKQRQAVGKIVVDARH